MKRRREKGKEKHLKECRRGTDTKQTKLKTLFYWIPSPPCQQLARERFRRFVNKKEWQGKQEKREMFLIILS